MGGDTGSDARAAGVDGRGDAGCVVGDDSDGSMKGVRVARQVRSYRRSLVGKLIVEGDARNGINLHST